MHTITRTFAAGVFAAGIAAAFAQTAQPAPVLSAQADACRSCGTVESVSQVQRTEKTKGIAGTKVTPGMAIGGVVGGVVGNQVVGGGAATVLGAAGGAYAGHEIERHNHRYTAYVMHIRMDDGTTRTIEQRTAIARGSHVFVEGHTARLRGREPARG